MIPALIISTYIFVGLVSYVYLTRKFAWREWRKDRWRGQSSGPSEHNFEMARFDSVPIAIFWPISLSIYVLWVLANAAVKLTEHIVPMSKDEKLARSEMKARQK